MNKWEEYELLKKIIIELNLTSEQYEKAMKKIAERLLL